MRQHPLYREEKLRSSASTESDVTPLAAHFQRSEGEAGLHFCTDNLGEE